MPVEGHVTEKPKPDPNVKVPPAVKAAADRAEALMNQQREARSEAKGGNTPESRINPPALKPAQMMTADFDPNNPKPPGPGDLPLFKASQAPPQPAPQPMPEAPQAPQPSPQDLEHQFSSLKGRYDRTQDDNKRMAAQIQDMQRLFASLQTAPAAPPQGGGQEGSGVRFSGPTSGARRYIQPKEEQEYGPELLDVMGRRTMEVVEQPLAQIQAELAGIKRQLGGVQRTVVYDAQTKMYQQLGQEVPHWSQINEHPEFHRWLNIPDPMSGRIRQEMLSEAYGRNEASRVAHVFKAFLADQAPYNPNGNGPVNGQGRDAGNGAGSSASPQQFDLMQFAAPGRAKPGQTSVGSPEKPIITAAEIKQFYSDSAQGKYTGREQDYNAIQQQIMEAMRDNRIRR